MVSTRNHPKNFPEPEASPTKASPPEQARKRRSAPLRRRGWTHEPSRLTILWLAVSLPLVVWDTGYVLGRPYTMPGGALHSPIWTPYALYGTIDHVYGWPAWEERNGWTAAQASLNVVETALYLAYLWIVAQNGRGSAQGSNVFARLAAARPVPGSAAGLAVLIGFSASVMTLSKTGIYGLNEHFSGWKSVGHNDVSSLIFLWIIPNGAWLVFSAYMTYVFGAEVLEGLAIAAGEESPTPRLAIKDE